MSRAQWGHGFWRGMEAARKAAGSLIGRYFHSFKDGELHRQGSIVAAVDDKYLVQLYSWLTGERTIQKLVDPADMDAWNFYETDEAMRWFAHTSRGGTAEDWAAQERLVAHMKEADECSAGKGE